MLWWEPTAWWGERLLLCQHLGDLGLSYLLQVRAQEMGRLLGLGIWGSHQGAGCSSPFHRVTTVRQLMLEDG